MAITRAGKKENNKGEKMQQIDNGGWPKLLFIKSIHEWYFFGH